MDQRDPPWGRTRWGRPRWGPVSRRRRWRQSQVMRLAAVGLVAVAAWIVVRAFLPEAPDPGLPTLVMAHDRPLGSTLTADDLRVERRVADERPAGALESRGSRGRRGRFQAVLAGEIVRRRGSGAPPQWPGWGPGPWR